jgi:hypothetical protein
MPPWHLGNSGLGHSETPSFSPWVRYKPKASVVLKLNQSTEQDFREFTFTNAAMLHTRNNPGFFKGTVVEQAVADELGLKRASPAATA